MPNSLTCLELAGITDFAGKLDRPVVAGEYLVPGTCWVESGYVVWSEREPSCRCPNGTLLDDFLRVRRGDEALSEFVAEWGPLNLLEHTTRWLRSSVPTITDQQSLYFLGSLFEMDLPYCDEGDATLEQRSAPPHGGFERREPGVYYTGFSQYVQKLLNLAAEIYSNKAESEWLKRYPVNDLDDDDNPYGLERAREEVEVGVARLLAMGSVSFGLRWKVDQWQIETQFFGLIGALATKLMLAVARADSLYTCSSCGQAYIRSARPAGGDGVVEHSRRRRMPRPGERNYCSDCGNKRARQDAKQTYRKKQRVIKLYREGVGISEIAIKTGADSKDVSKWVRGVQRVKA